MTNDSLPSGLTVDGVPVPLAIEAEGPEAIEQHVLTQLEQQRTAAPDVAPTEGAQSPPTTAEGVE